MSPLSFPFPTNGVVTRLFRSFACIFSAVFPRLSPLRFQQNDKLSAQHPKEIRSVSNDRLGFNTISTTII